MTLYTVKRAIAVLAMLFIASCQTTTSADTPKILSIKEVKARIDYKTYKPVKYRNNIGFQCIKCKDLQRIYIFPHKRNIKTYRFLSNPAASVSDYDAKKVVKYLVKEKSNVISAKVRKKGKDYYLDAVFETYYSGGTLRNVIRLVAMSDYTSYGALGVSKSEARSRQLMKKGLSWVK